MEQREKSANFGAKIKKCLNRGSGKGGLSKLLKGRANLGTALKRRLKEVLPNPT